MIGGSKSFGCTSARVVRAVEAAFELRETRDAVVDEPRSARTRSLRRLPVQRHNGQLGAQTTHLGHAHGQLADGERCEIARYPRPRSLSGAGGRTPQQTHGRRRARRRAVRPSQRPQLFTGILLQIITKWSNRSKWGPFQHWYQNSN